MRKNIQFLILAIIVLTATSEAFAQKFGVKAGLNLSNVLYRDNYIEYTYNEISNYKTKLGFHVGATAELPLNDKFSLETGLLFSTKGYRVSGIGDSDIARWKDNGIVNLMYLDIPLAGKATFDVGGTKVYGLFGSYLGMGLVGKTKIETEGIKELNEKYKRTYEYDIQWGSDKEKPQLKRLDFGLTAGTGVEIKSFQIGVAYQLGLANISSVTANDKKISNRVFSVSVGYILSKK